MTTPYSYLLDLLGIRTIKSDGVGVPISKTVDFLPPLSAEYNPTTGAVEVTSGGGPTGTAAAPFLPTSESSPIDVAEYPNPTNGYTVTEADIGRTLLVTGEVTLILPEFGPSYPVGAMFGAFFNNGGAVRAVSAALNTVQHFEPANRPIYFEGAPSGWNGLLFGSSEYVVFRKVSDSGEGESYSEVWNVWRLMRPAPLAPIWVADSNETGTFTLLYGFFGGVPYANKSLTLTGNVTLDGYEFLGGPGNYLLKVTNTGSFTLDWPGDWLGPGGTIPAPTASATDLYGIAWDGTEALVYRIGAAFAP